MKLNDFQIDLLKEISLPLVDDKRLKDLNTFFELNCKIKEELKSCPWIVLHKRDAVKRDFYRIKGDGFDVGIGLPNHSIIFENRDEVFHNTVYYLELLDYLEKKKLITFIDKDPDEIKEFKVPVIEPGVGILTREVNPIDDRLWQLIKEFVLVETIPLPDLDDFIRTVEESGDHSGRKERKEQNIVSNKPLYLKTKLEKYKNELDGILKRFTRTSNSMDINRDDQYKLHTIVNELQDLLNDNLGPNIYTKQIIDNYNQGKLNYFSSSSYSSVRYIQATVQAATTKVQEIIDNPKKHVRFTTGNRVFIGHGGSPIWRELKDFLTDRLKLLCEEFNSSPSAGYDTKERLEEMLNKSCFAFLIMTAEDVQKDGSVRARENVVHEVGLFQGRLGFNKAIILLEEGCEKFSNIEGLTCIQFSKNNIKMTFEEIRKTLERENILKS